MSATDAVVGGDGGRNVGKAKAEVIAAGAAAQLGDSGVANGQNGHGSTAGGKLAPANPAKELEGARHPTTMEQVTDGHGNGATESTEGATDLEEVVATVASPATSLGMTITTVAGRSSSTLKVQQPLSRTVRAGVVGGAIGAGIASHTSVGLGLQHTRVVHIPKAPRVNVRVRWTQEEDRRLESIIAKMGARNWKLLAMHLGNRTDKQCRERWHNHLSPGVRPKVRWTAEEDTLLLDLISKHGNRWARFSKHYPGRTDNDLKNRFHGHLRPKQLRMQASAQQSDNVAQPYSFPMATRGGSLSLSRFPIPTSDTMQDRLPSSGLRHQSLVPSHHLNYQHQEQSHIHEQELQRRIIRPSTDRGPACEAESAIMRTSRSVSQPPLSIAPHIPSLKSKTTSLPSSLLSLPQQPAALTSTSTSAMTSSVASSAVPSSMAPEPLLLAESGVETSESTLSTRPLTFPSPAPPPLRQGMVGRATRSVGTQTDVLIRTRVVREERLDEKGRQIVYLHHHHHHHHHHNHIVSLPPISVPPEPRAAPHSAAIQSHGTAILPVQAGGLEMPRQHLGLQEGVAVLKTIRSTSGEEIQRQAKRPNTLPTFTSILANMTPEERGAGRPQDEMLNSVTPGCGPDTTNGVNRLTSNSSLHKPVHNGSSVGLAKSAPRLVATSGLHHKEGEGVFNSSESRPA